MPAQRNGFSLIEVMVSLVILTVGLIGIFNLHIISKRGSFESFQQTQASYYANDMINRMKLNPSQLANYAGTYSGTPTEPSPNCTTATCNSGEMLAWDLYEWRASFNGADEVVGTQNVGGLDTATACVIVNNNTVNVIMSWKGIRETSDAGNNEDCGTANDRRRLYSVETVII
ncbi:type IV pilus modification protein PilV [Shewanella sp. UCD-KL21]|uniref:type IV pilus modification protein PilV n=1 Tax=Shewanella sp. UCD-KL21 TaxID=1917164 RepID=UPI00097104B4|nr:type IV pilus modification protein PilV [Shewanella sp. UCD-KL21]